MARMANITSRQAEAELNTVFAGDIRITFNEAFYSGKDGYYKNKGSVGNSNATQTAQALALNSGLVLDRNREKVSMPLSTSPMAICHHAIRARLVWVVVRVV